MQFSRTNVPLINTEIEKQMEYSFISSYFLGKSQKYSQIILHGSFNAVRLLDTILLFSNNVV